MSVSRFRRFSQERGFHHDRLCWSGCCFRRGLTHTNTLSASALILVRVAKGLFTHRTTTIGTGYLCIATRWSRRWSRRFRRWCNLFHLLPRNTLGCGFHLDYLVGNGVANDYFVIVLFLFHYWGLNLGLSFRLSFHHDSFRCGFGRNLRNVIRTSCFLKSSSCTEVILCILHINNVYLSFYPWHIYIYISLLEIFYF